MHDSGVDADNALCRKELTCRVQPFSLVDNINSDRPILTRPLLPSRPYVHTDLGTSYNITVFHHRRQLRPPGPPRFFVDRSLGRPASDPQVT